MPIEAFIKGWLGEQGTRLVQGIALDSKQYHKFYDILIPTGTGSTQIDHVVVSKYGVFVVETKNYDGWIFGGTNDKLWTQIIFNSKVRFQNPLHQNYLHTKSFAEFCSIEDKKIHSVVVFWGKCEFKTKMPKNVIQWHKYAGYIKDKKQILLTEEEVTRICEQLDNQKGHIPIVSNLQNVNIIKKQYNNPTVCPKCQGKLVERVIQKGNAAGQKFWGCENYPKCRYTRNLK